MNTEVVGSESKPYPWIVYHATDRALSKVFQVSDGQHQQLVQDSPFLELVVEHYLARTRQDHPQGERYVTIKKRCIELARDTPLYHSNHCSIAAVNAFEVAIGSHLPNTYLPNHPSASA